MGFVQADPIRAPARAQDLILRHRVKNYHAGDLEWRYATLDIEEDFFIIYGFVAKSLHTLMHPRSDGEGGRGEKGKGEMRKTQLLLEFVRERGAVHPREVDEHFSHGTVTNYWGGSSNATTHLLDAMHYRGLLRVARREKGIRIYSARDLPTNAGRDACAPGPGSNDAERWARIDALVDVIVRIYAPLPGPSLSSLVSRLRLAVPQWREELPGALQRAKERLSHARVNSTLPRDGTDLMPLVPAQRAQRAHNFPGTRGFALRAQAGKDVCAPVRRDGVDWYWPADENPMTSATQEGTHDTVRLLAPFDPVVRDRNRFELLWGWEYRFEAYTPAPKRKLGYYALPLLWRDRVIGWANLSVKNGVLDSEFGYAGVQPRDRAFKRELEAELDRMRVFLGLES
jgi:uncharacterized protein YcaQ